MGVSVTTFPRPSSGETAGYLYKKAQLVNEKSRSDTASLRTVIVVHCQ